MGIPHLLLFATPLLLLVMAIEYRLSKKRRRDLYDRSDTKSNFGIAFGGILFGGLASAYGLSLYYFFYTQAAPFRQAFLRYGDLGWTWYVWVFAVLADDFTYYWFHRISHQVHIFWAFHVVHHSSEHFNYSTAIRNGWLSILHKPFFWIWMSIVGFHPLMIITCMSLNSFYQFFCHTQLCYSWKNLQCILCAPEIHAIHHGKNEAFIDKNFAGIFTFYDRLFGTFMPHKKGQAVDFGVTHPPKSNNIFEITFHELVSLFRLMKKEANWRSRIVLLFRAPK
ncbi:MAG TPA: sterol desaturase family protein [Saprospiraceae bacterium]|nr:sterol desaturase family protein [Saprospiraceae bacterium]HMQ82927.1 sterol desaturase family protein [Saprospiraceae bacterium]